MKRFINKTAGSILLVAGTQIGAGMLALPITTGPAGYLPSMILFIVSFFYMLMSLFLLMEVNLWSHNITANMITLAKEHLGLIGQFVAWGSYLLLLYAVAAAYISAGGSLIAGVLNSGLVSPISPEWGMCLFVLIFGFFVIYGTRGVDVINRVMMVGLLISFVLLIIFIIPQMNFRHFEMGKPSFLWGSIPVVILSFTSHIIVPSLRSYLTGDTMKLRRALFWGSILPLIVYLVWVTLIMGVLPIEGEFSLDKIRMSPHPVAALTHAMSTLINFHALSSMVGIFSFCALVTSFFGVALSLFDFLADGLNMKKTPINKLILIALMFIPPFLFSVLYPKGFILALGYAGVFVAILYGLLPSLMIYKGRYLEKIEAKYRVPGGKAVPIIVFIGAVFIIAIQIAVTNHWLPNT